MKKKITFACSLILCAILLLTACQKDGAVGDGSLSDNNGISNDNSPPNENAPSGSASNNASGNVGEKEWVYVPEMVTVETQRADYGGMQLVGGRICYLTMNGESSDDIQKICQYLITDQTLTDTPIDWPMQDPHRDVVTYLFDRDYNVWLTANVYSADYSQLNRFLCKFDADGKNIISQNITEQLGRGSDISGMTTDEQGRLYIFAGDEGIWLYHNDGSFYGSIPYKLPEQFQPQSQGWSPGRVQIRGSFQGTDGRFYVCRKVDDSEYCSLWDVDFEKMQMTKVTDKFPDISGICGEEASDNLIVYDNTGVYEYDFSSVNSSKQNMKETLTWADSDINGYFVVNAGVLEDDRYVCIVEDWEHEDLCVALLTKTRAEDAPVREELTLAAVGDGSELAAMAVRFNRGNSQYHLTVKNYDSLTELYNAILAKEPMDIIDLSGIDARKLVRQDVLEDLTPFLEQSKVLEASGFVDGILDIYTFDGILTGIPSCFWIQTLAGNGARLENQAGLTLEELLKTAERNPDTPTLNGVTREEMLRYLILFNEDTFIDWEKGVCHFDSEIFQEVLKYVSRFPDSLNDGEDSFQPSRFQNGEVLFAVGEMKTLNAFQELAWSFGEDAACVGFPTPGGQGGHLLFASDAYGIATVSEHKEGAWRFIESFLSEEKSQFYYAKRGTNFSTLKSVLNENVESGINSQLPADHYPRRIYEDETVFQFHLLTWDEVNVILDLIPEAKPWFDLEDNPILQIISEDAQIYYSGQKNAADVAGVIQNRVQVYLDENL